LADQAGTYIPIHLKGNFILNFYQAKSRAGRSNSKIRYSELCASGQFHLILEMPMVFYQHYFVFVFVFVFAHVEIKNDNHSVVVVGIDGKLYF